MAHYYIKPERKNLHGVLSGSIPPILTIHPGDSVFYATIDPDWRIAPPVTPSTDSGQFMQRYYPHDRGHALCGPLAIQGAVPGQTLVIHMNEIVPSSWGWSRVGSGDADHLARLQLDEEEYFLIWDLDSKQRICKSHLGHQISMRPFMGVLAVAPAAAHEVPTHLPGNHGANLDCKEIVAGSTLYLPIYKKGALFSVGDGHACQGDGESGGTAIECPMDRVRITFDLLDYPLETPICYTPNGWITFGFHEDLTQAAYFALTNMCRLLEGLYKVSRKEALALTSVATDLHITQIVNGVRGVHAVFPHNSILL